MLSFLQTTWRFIAGLVTVTSRATHQLTDTFIQHIAGETWTLLPPRGKLSTLHAHVQTACARLLVVVCWRRTATHRADCMLLHAQAVRQLTLITPIANLDQAMATRASCAVSSEQNSHSCRARYMRTTQGQPCTQSHRSRPSNRYASQHIEGYRYSGLYKKGYKTLIHSILSTGAH